MIKKIYILLLAVLGIGVFASCADQLDSDKYFRDRLTIEAVFESKTHAEEWLAYAYSFLKGENNEVTTKDVGYNPFCFADDMYYGDRDKTIDATKNELSYNMFKLGEYDENSYNVGAWGACYKGIYQASVFIHNIDKCKEMADWEILDYKGQARFVRAYYYWLLLRRYGPVPIMPDEGVDYTQSYEQIATPRSSYEEVAEFISDEMIQAAKELQYDFRTDNYAVSRPTRGAALAARAYALIFAASPFANGNNDGYAQQLVDDEGRRLLSAEYSEEKWARAAAACKDVMNLGVYELNYVGYSTSDNGPSDRPTITPPNDNNFSGKTWPYGWANIDPLKSYRMLFDGTLLPANNKELIFTRGATSIDMMVLHQMPKDDGGWNCHGITQKMCDAYYMADGKDVQGKDNEIGRGDGSARLTGFIGDGSHKAEDYKYCNIENNVSVQYADREPRFYASIAYNGSTWYYLSTKEEDNKRNQQVWYYFASPDGYRNDGFYLRTGIGIKKFVHPNDYPGNYVAKAETAIRYADILLLYAEALNELDGTYNIPSWDESMTYTISRNKEEMQKGIHPVRIRAGLPDYTETQYASKDELRKALKRERMIELMGEGKRYFDLRRWKDAPIEEALQIYGCNVFVAEANRDEFHSPIPIYNLPSTFSEKLWLWPIKHSELKRNPRLTQNPGWTMFD
ncbi:Starch-binding associating with outer membrane [Bacteroides faecichinchillae]|uniref:Starch-binding associating with outer membrane n=1 Tax=Bacteroides faecichinchillae TaxID=871325 RepID=A0A1M5EQZ0_9BACE|nr:RagB/SusD family nutrient uptake outer membrane protein [Bacteroides faecichinchillae]THG54541.1 RagB/SusD family nutrient uptake outer membrane protein [Bacteroides faecichinchillae]SHF81698.1 Starch-binding associating with outer membrane [Bacteroides faecichinchillae]